MGLTFNLGRDSAALTSDASLNVGIGGSPSGSYKLEVTGTAKVSSTLLVSGAATFSSNITFNGNGTQANNTLFTLSNGYMYVDGNTNGLILENNSSSSTRIRLEAADNMQFQTASTERMRITSAGNVGIGTTSPSNKLEVYTGANDGIKINSADVPSLFFYLSGGSQKNWGIASTNLAAGDFGIYQSNSNAGNPITAGTARLYITSGGDVSIGSGLAAANSFNFYQNYSGGQLGFNFYNSSSQIVFGFNGNSQTINLKGLSGTGNRAVYSDASGILTNTSSDGTLKTNVTPIVYGLDSVLNLKPISFNWIDTENMGTQTEIGFIAQEVKELIPEVIGINNNETLSLDYPKLTAVLVKAIQELSQQNQELKERLDKAGL